MRTILFTISTALLFATTSLAGFEFWTNRDGKTASMELLEVIREEGTINARFKLEDGREITLSVERFNEESAARIRSWQPEVAVESVFDEALKGNLVILDGKRFTKHELVAPPKKFYVFYYTASWCPPCQAFTPSLVDFYRKNKNEHFELVLVSSDRDEKDMLGYATKANMPWPQIEFREVRRFRSKFDHGVRGIPSVIVCDLQGNQVPGNFRDLKALANLVK